MQKSEYDFGNVGFNLDNYVTILNIKDHDFSADFFVNNRNKLANFNLNEFIYSFTKLETDGWIKLNKRINEISLILQEISYGALFHKKLAMELEKLFNKKLVDNIIEDLDDIKFCFVLNQIGNDNYCQFEIKVYLNILIDEGIVCVEN